MSKLMSDAIVITVVLLLVAFLFLEYDVSLKEAYSKIFGKATCEASVRAHAALKLGFADFSDEIKCPTIKLKIDDKNEEVVKKKIADAMVDCWDQYGQGKLDLFKDDNVYCAVCHRITFDKDIQVKGFLRYLADKNPKQGSISYIKYLSTEKTQNSDFLNELSNNYVDDTILASQQNEYAVIFTYIKGKQYLKDYTNKAGHLAPGVGLMVFGAGVVFKVAPAALTAPIIGIPLAAKTAAAGTVIFGIGALWSYLAVTYGGVPCEHIALVNFIPYDSQYLQNLNSREIPIKQ